MTLLCFSLVFHYNHVFCGVCNAWAISGRQVGNKNYIIGKLQIFLASFHLVQNLPSKCELGASGVQRSKQHYREISVSRVSSAL